MGDPRERQQSEAAAAYQLCCDLKAAKERIAELETVLRNVLDRGCRLALAEDVTDSYGYIAVPHEEMIAEVRAVLGIKEESSGG